MSAPLSTHLGSPSQTHSYAAWLRRVRLWSGLALFAYVTTHLANHALGLVSLVALEVGRGWFLLLWRNPLGTTVLYGALVSHVALALWSLYQRRRLHMSIWEAVQLLMGLTIPFLLTTHVVGTRLAHAWFEVQDSYTYVVLALWWYRPDLGVLQAIVLLLAWLHGCIGMHFWLRLQPWYGRVVPWLFGVAILLPTLALLGFVQAGGPPASAQGAYRYSYGLWCGYWSHPGGACPTPALRTAARDDPNHVSQRAEGQCPIRLQRTRGEPLCQDPTRLGVWRQGALLNVQGACRTRRSLCTASQCGRAPCP
jgi:adenylate cyclase